MNLEFYFKKIISHIKGISELREFKLLMRKFLFNPHLENFYQICLHSKMINLKVFWINKILSK